MHIETERYPLQSARWPAVGRHILAYYDDSSILVYQAYRRSIGEYAITHQKLGGPDFSFSRMSWIKPNFLWMMYRSGWGTKEGQEIVLALKIRRVFFDELLCHAVPSSFDPRFFQDQAAWARAVEQSQVRLQWDPDHAPSGAPLARKAVQLGLRREALERFATDELLEVIDMSEFVAAQRQHAAGFDASALLTPVERIYVPTHSPRHSQIDSNSQANPPAF